MQITEVIEARPITWRHISDIYPASKAERMLRDIEVGRLQGFLVGFPNYVKGFVFLEGMIAPVA